MLAEKNSVVTLTYVLRDDQGKVLEESGNNLTFVVSQGAVLKGLEEAVLGFGVDSTIAVTLSPEQAYGFHDPKKVQVLPKDYFGAEPVRVGDQFYVDTNAGSEILKVMEVNEEHIVIDYNSMLAGARLNFLINVIHIRKATDIELEKGIKYTDQCEKTNKIALVQA
ncbi:MAG: peptidylprolyl isomerase [Gammaproteobacteria bacterium]|nr:MAG: peptidylprolyl isomerase [Gammaproteobacteria bacterium]